MVHVHVSQCHFLILNTMSLAFLIWISYDAVFRTYYKKNASPGQLTLRIYQENVIYNLHTIVRNT